MAKNMYSLMLSEAVVDAVDTMAHSAGASRSAMVERILAEYVSYRTPEMRINEMFERMERLLSPERGLQTMLRSSERMLNLRSALSYKYNPTVRYSVELYRVMSGTVGELRVGLRTQNSTLRLYLMQFFKLWSRIESSYVPQSDYAIEDGRYTKRLIPRSRSGGEIDEDELSAAIVEYISALDAALKAFFYNIDEPQRAIAEVEKAYRGYYMASSLII